MLNEKNLRRVITVILIAMVIVLFSVTTDSFLSRYNILLLFKDAAYTGLIALGVCCVMVCGGVDLSAGGIVCIVGVAVARASFIPGIPGFAVLLIGLAAGLACGLINGLIVSKLHLTEFVTTLATGSVFTGLALLTTFKQHGRAVSTAITNKGFLMFGGHIDGLYLISIAWIILVIVFQILYTKTPLGTYISAVGSNPKSAQMSGISKGKMKIVTFMLSGGFAGLAASFMVAYQTASTLTLGSGMEFQAIAACVVGGVAMTGGKGDAVTAALGTIFLTLITNGLYKWGLSTGALNLLTGIIIIAVINFDTVLASVSHRRMMRKANPKEVLANE